MGDAAMSPTFTSGTTAMLVAAVLVLGLVTSQELDLVYPGELETANGIVPELSFVETLADPQPKAPAPPPPLAKVDSDIWSKEMQAAKDAAAKALHPAEFLHIHKQCMGIRKTAAESCGQAFCDVKGKCGQPCPAGSKEAPMGHAQVIPLQPGTEDNAGMGPFHYVKEVEDKEEQVKERLAKEKDFKEKQAKESKEKEADYKAKAKQEQAAKSQASLDAVDKERAAKEKSAAEMSTKTDTIESKEADMKKESTAQCTAVQLKKQQQCEKKRSAELDEKASEKEEKQARSAGSAASELAVKAGHDFGAANEAATEAAEAHNAYASAASMDEFRAGTSAVTPSAPVASSFGETESTCQKLSAATCITTLGCYLDVNSNTCNEGEDAEMKETEAATGSAAAIAKEEGKHLYKLFDRCCSGDYEPIGEIGMCQAAMLELKPEAQCVDQEENAAHCDGSLTIAGWDTINYPNGCWFENVPTRTMSGFFVADGGYAGCSSPDEAVEEILSGQSENGDHKVVCKLNTTPAEPTMCPEGYTAVTENLDGTGKVWSKPHPDPNRSKEECAGICDAREGCTGFEYAEGPSEHGACGTYTGGDSNKEGDENRLTLDSNWRSCIKNPPPPPPAPPPICPEGYEAVTENLDGTGKVWSKPHPDPNRSMADCEAICNSREGCTGFEYAEGPSEHGACGTYTGGDSNKKGDENRL